MPSLIPECEFHADLYLNEIGPVPLGKRIWGGVTGGTLKGDRLKGKLTPVGGDWLIVDPNGFGQIDVRIQFLTHDDALINVYYGGVIEMTSRVQAVLGGGDDATDYGDQYFFTNVRMEAGDTRYAWVNNKMFVGYGRAVPGPAVEYQIFRLEN